MDDVASQIAGILPAYGYVNDVREQDGMLRLVGWMMLEDGPFDAIQMRCDDPPVDQPATQFHAPALAAIHLPDAAHAGFEARIAMPELGGRTFELVAIGMRNARAAGFLRLGYHRPPLEQDYPDAATMVRSTMNEGHAFYRANGMKACNDFRRAMAPHLDLDGVRHLLDWGCGAGRVTKHLIDRFPRAQVHGTDIDEEAVQWAAAHVGPHFTVCRRDPPLPFRDGLFDAVVSASVFTHLTEHYQQLWLRELRRLVRPGGIVCASTQGEFAARWAIKGTPAHRAMLDGGIFDGIPDPGLGHVASTEYYRTTFQTRQYTEQAWGRWFTVLEYFEAGINNIQDLYVLRRSS